MGEHATPGVVPSGAYDPATAPAGERIGKFVRVAKLGTGGMGEVWKAWDVELSRWVALKFLRGGNDDELARFRREAQMAGRLSHPNIAAIYEIGDVAGRPFIAMQLVDGRTLMQLRSRDLRRLARLAAAAARAVAFAHERGVVHRDLKPDNVMVAADDHVYVMDFGLARPMEGASRVSVTGCVVGTPGFMAPEQARGERVDGRADVYGLGATLYALLAGAPPFEGANVLQVLQAVQEREPRPLRKIDPAIPRELETIVLKCLEKERGRRYGSMTDLADDLDRWLAGEPILAHGPSTVYRLRKAVARHRGLSIAVAATIVLLPAVTLAVRAMHHERRRLETRARELESETHRSRGRDEAFRLLEMGRPALDRAHRALYEEGTPYEDVVRAADQARTLIEDAARRAPDMAVAQLLLGRAWAVQGRRDLAEACWRRAIELDPNLGPAHYRLGHLLVARAFLASVARSQHAPGIEERVRRLGEEAARELERAASTSGEGDVELERDLAAAFLPWARGDCGAAERLARAGAARHAGKTGSEEFDWLAGLASTGDARMRAFDAAIARRPKFDVALFCRAFDHATAGRMAPAIDDLTAALRANPHFHEAIGMRGIARQMSGDLRGALADYDDLVTRTRAPADHLNRGAVRAALDDPEGAMADYLEAARLDPSLAEAHVNVANAHARARRIDEALAAYAEAERRNPDIADIYNGRAGVHVQRGDHDAALADWARCLERKPDHLQALASRGQVLARIGRPAEARADLERALRVAPPGWPHRALIERELARLR